MHIFFTILILNCQIQVLHIVRVHLEKVGQFLSEHLKLRDFVDLEGLRFVRWKGKDVALVAAETAATAWGTFHSNLNFTNFIIFPILFDQLNVITKLLLLLSYEFSVLG